MSSIDPEVLYLILTKVASKGGTINPRELGEAYERITGSRVGARVSWEKHLAPLNALLGKCGLPPLGGVLSVDGKTADNLSPVHSAKWPSFSALKALYTRRN